MLVSHKHKFIYAKTIKTGGTSVESFFEPFCMHADEWEFTHARDEYESTAGIIGYRGPALTDGQRVKWSPHMHAADMRQQLGPTVYDSYFKFCVIRNPF